MKRNNYINPTTKIEILVDAFVGIMSPTVPHNNDGTKETNSRQGVSLRKLYV